ncbi:DEAD/DEAH box helicase [Fundicoccus culcitae]|uniref:DEAD/DEAH box helicase n=1 Tax=Fundicoccus culcitae TaxID=2969821 RepID=A0ABY5P868_9LACT|nr:DEAD/DEAH box helicase [Fundicoccus culcitae]UUX34588.1 DEAD/DEAH box helicase [Fundicoccus culcitae]
MTTIQQLAVDTYIIKALEALNFTELTPVQERVIPKVLDGKSLIVQSQTGSGKSHSFIVPIMQKINPKRNEVQAVITAPSRELATQLYQVAVQINQFAPSPIQIVNYIGGTDKARQIEKLHHQQPQLVIGTPGRIFDLMKENALWVQTANMMVIDEADMTLDLGFLTIVDEIASRLSKDLQLMAFSATIPQQLTVFLKKYMDQPETIIVETKEIIADTITNYLIQTRSRDRKEIIYQLLTIGHPYLALIFGNTTEYVDELSLYLKEKGLKVATIHGNIPPRERKKVMKQIRDLEFQYVVASDLAARGIDIPGVSMVINSEVPKELEFFVHRVGRTGRNQLEGTAYTLVTPDDDEAIAQLENKGIEFQTVDIVNNEIVEVTGRQQRKRRKEVTKEVDPTVQGMISRSKKQKVKPGYKKKLKYQISDHKRLEAKRTNRLEQRAQRRKKRDQHHPK